MAPSPITYLKGQEYNQLLDHMKSKEIGYTKAQLAEIGGSVISQYILDLSETDDPIKDVIFIIGQDYNSYFGLVAARQLAQMKFNIEIIFLFDLDGIKSRLAQQCRVNGAKLTFNLIQQLQDQQKTQVTKNIIVDYLNSFDIIVDAITIETLEPLKQPAREYVHSFTDVQQKVISINLPAGWNADDGNINAYFQPKSIISIGIPLKALKSYQGNLIIGGRFIPNGYKNYTLAKFRQDDFYLSLKI
ncbi:hypothetical protein pb186bvf_010617 [Paramecium bursaria]